MTTYQRMMKSGVISNVSLERDTFGQVKSARFIERDANHPNVRGLHYVVRGCSTCEGFGSVQPMLLFIPSRGSRGPSIWEGYYCAECGRWYWVRPMRAAHTTVQEVRYLIAREGWSLSERGEKYLQDNDYMINSAVNRTRAQNSRELTGDYRQARETIDTLERTAVRMADSARLEQTTKARTRQDEQVRAKIHRRRR